MYAAKSGGRRTHRFFEPAMDASAKARLTMEQDLRQALVEGSFELHYQPLVDLGRNEVSGCEALLRWRHPERGMVSPAEFIPVAEDTGLINEIGDWVLRTACAEAATWPEHIRLAVNVSPVQLKNQTLALRIAGALAASGLQPSRLEIEITEAVLIRDDEAALAILHQLRDIGVRIALDDFGTGFSSLSYLKRFPFDKIKIDRCFVSDISEVDASSSIVQAVVNIAAALNMTTTAEGVETEAQRELLRKLGCTEMQGYLFSRPKPGAEVKRLFGMAGDAVAVGITKSEARAAPPKLHCRFHGGAPILRRRILMRMEASHAACLDPAEHALDSHWRRLDGGRLADRRRHHGHHHHRDPLGPRRLQYRRLHPAAVRLEGREPLPDHRPG